MRTGQEQGKDKTRNWSGERRQDEDKTKARRRQDKDKMNKSVAGGRVFRTKARPEARGRARLQER
jgi:hypothetical protein